MSEWRELSTLAAVAAAQAAGDEIEVEVYTLGESWIPWDGRYWNKHWKYRARSKPKVKKIKILGWIDPDSGDTFTRSEDFPIETISGWIRDPYQDREVEVPL